MDAGGYAVCWSFFVIMAALELTVRTVLLSLVLAGTTASTWGLSSFARYANYCNASRCSSVCVLAC